MGRGEGGERERERREVVLQKGGMKPTPVFRTHFGMRAAAGSAGLAGSVLFSATGSARLISRAGAGAAGAAGTAGAEGAAGGASVRLSAAGCRIATTKEGEEGLVDWLLAAAVADEGAVVVVVSPAEPCWKESANRANSRRGSETRKRKHIIFFPEGQARFPRRACGFRGAWPEVWDDLLRLESPRLLPKGPRRVNLLID